MNKLKDWLPVLFGFIGMIWIMGRKEQNDSTTYPNPNTMPPPTVGTNLSYTLDEFKQYASDLERSMRGGGTTENLYFDTMNKLTTPQDVKEVYRVFGIRDSDNLIDWVKGDFSGKELENALSYFKTAGFTV